MSSGNGVFAEIVPTAAPSISAAAARFELLPFMAQRGELPEESLTPRVPRRADRALLYRGGRLIRQPEGRLLWRLSRTLGRLFRHSMPSATSHHAGRTLERIGRA